jgi:hypothetical protein
LACAVSARNLKLKVVRGRTLSVRAVQHFANERWTFDFNSGNDIIKIQDAPCPSSYVLLVPLLLHRGIVQIHTELPQKPPLAEPVFTGGE